MNSDRQDKIRIAIAGNPNCGKTCLFNNFTGAHQKVANWPGVTVERKIGTFSYRNREFEVVDLPGTYSLSAYSIEEEVVERFVCETPPDILINIVDATNLERHLVLTAQFLEMGVPMILALNMMDEADAIGLSIDTEKLSRMLDVPVVPTVARRNVGTRDLLREVLELIDAPRVPSRTIDYGAEIEATVDSLKPFLPETETKLSEHIRLVMLLSGRHALPVDANNQTLQLRVAEARTEIERAFGERAGTVFDGHWFGFANGAARMCVSQSRKPRFNLTERIDDFVTHPLLGLVIFIACMWVTFQLVFTLGNPLTGLIEAGVDGLGTLVGAILPDSFLKSLVVDGIIAGVGGVIVFLPNILLLFLAIGFLEDSGYMARAAFVMDRIMHMMGLHGKSFIPMLVGFGCTVPAVMATRSLDTRRDRIITALVTPFMSCAARLPVYTLFITAFFAPRSRTPVLFSLYIMGIVVAILMANVIGRLFFGKQQTPLLMELPPYRLPTLRSVLILMWMRAWMYLKKAGTIILVAAVVMWYLSSYPKMTEGKAREYLASAGRPSAALTKGIMGKLEIEYSYAGRIGKFIEPVFAPLGFDWKVSVGLLTGLAAKEVVVSTLGVIYGVGEVHDESEDLQGILRKDPVFKDNPLAAYTFMVFVLLYIPCLAVVAVFFKEFGLRWTSFLLLYTTVVAWLAAFVVRAAGLALGF